MLPVGFGGMWQVSTPEMTQNAERDQLSKQSEEISRETSRDKELRNWIEKLEEYESSIVEDKDNYKRVDVNGYYSYSCMQFQLYTFWGYYEEWKEMKVTEKEARELIANCERQKRLAVWMIKDDYSNWTHWRYSVEKRGLGYPPKNEKTEKKQNSD